MTPAQFEEARRLHAAGLKLCELYPNSKRPVGDGWNNKAISAVRQDAGGYGLLLAANGMCSVDVDTEHLCKIGLEKCGFDLEAIRDAGVHTSSTRPGSGGRVTFKVPAGAGLRWLKFSSKEHGTILELRAESPNLQDSLPGTVYNSQDGSGPWVQDYAGIWTLDCAPEPPDALLAWWLRMSTDVDYLREQQILFIGSDAQLAVSSGGGTLAYSSSHRISYNQANRVADILERHDYTRSSNGRYAPKTATGAASVREIPGRDDLWQSDHASDPLWGTFDAWTAHVVLDHGGDLASAESEADGCRAIAAVEGFEEEDVPVRRVAGPGDGVEEQQPTPAFERDKNGRIKPTINNLLPALRRPDIIGARIGLDKFRDEIMLATPGCEDWRPLKDADYVWLRSRLEAGATGFLPISRELIREVVLAVADELQFDSAIAWLQSLPWDGVQRCETFLIDHFGVEDTPYHRATARYMWTAMAGRVLVPGCKADMVPVLVGDQGLGKSTAIAALVPSPEFLVEVSFSEKEDDLARKMRGKLVAEIGELRGLHTKELESIKAFVTRTHEQWIPKYREFGTLFARRLIFFGTTNEAQFLADKSGHRRWLPIRVNRIDVGRIREVAALCWAEAALMVQAGGVQWADAERLAIHEHDEYKIEDSWETAVKQWLTDPLFGDEPGFTREFVTTADVLVGAFGFDPKQITRREEMRVAGVLKVLGYARKKVRVKDVTKWAYVPTKNEVVTQVGT